MSELLFPAAATTSVVIEGDQVDHVVFERAWATGSSPRAIHDIAVGYGSRIHDPIVTAVNGSGAAVERRFYADKAATECGDATPTPLSVVAAAQPETWEPWSWLTTIGLLSFSLTSHPRKLSM